MDNSIVVDGVVLPAPAQDGIQIKPEPIWSDNAGRTSTCYFVGDIRAVKTTLSISWGTLTYEQAEKIRSAFTHLGKPFFSLTYTDDTGQRQTINCYSTMPQSAVHTYRDECGNITGMTVDVVQR